MARNGDRLRVGTRRACEESVFPGNCKIDPAMIALIYALAASAVRRENRRAQDSAQQNKTTEKQ
jgi:hypothetical protein